jgi:hypothetical protein
MSRRRAWGRRQFLGAAGATALGLPWLRNFAHAADEPPRRLVVVYSPNESIDREFWALGSSGADVALPASLPSFLGPLDPFVSRLCLLADIRDEFADGHNAIHNALTGVAKIGPNNSSWAGGISVDQHIAASLGVDALTLGAKCGAKNGKGRLSYLGANQPVDPIENPTQAFDWLFTDFDLDPAELEAKRARRRSILDRAAGDLERFTQQVPTHERPKLEAHLAFVRELELKIDADVSASCEPTEPGVIVDPSQNESFPEVVRRQMDVMVQALACDVTPVATLQLTRAGGNITPLWPAENIEISVGEHNIAHEYYLNKDNPLYVNRRVDLETWYARQFAYLLEKLDAVPGGGGGTLLDETLVVWVKELAQRHASNPMLYVLAGAPTSIPAGRFVSYPGRPHNDLLLSLCHYMGVHDETFGDPSVTTGPLLT